MVTPLRPLSTGQLLDATFSLYRRKFLLFVGLVAIPNLLVLPFQLAQQTRSSLGFTWSLGAVALACVLFLAYLVTSAASTAATLVAVSDLYLGRTATVVGSLQSVAPIVPRVALISIAMGLAVFVGFLFCIAPGVILALMWALVVPVVALEKVSFTRAFSRSAELTSGYRGRIFLVFLLYFVIAVVLSMVLNLPLGVSVGVASVMSGTTALPTWLSVTQVVVSFINTCLTTPLMTIGLALIYYDLRVRKEAFDLQVLMSGPGAQAGAVPPVPGTTGGGTGA